MNDHRNHRASRHTSLRGGRAAARSVVIGLTALTLSSAPALAGATETAAAREPIEIELRLDTGLLAYDLAWSDHTGAARAELAAQAIEQMTDPATPYVLKIPQLPVVWRPLPAGFSTAPASANAPGSRRRAIRMRSSALMDMKGSPIDRAKARIGRIHYERDMQAALMDVVDQIRAARPGALLTIDQFIPPQSYGAQAGSYTDLLGDLDFVVVQMPSAVRSPARHRRLSRRARARVMESAPVMDTRAMERAFKMASAPDGMFVLVEENGAWTAVDDGPLPEVIQNADADSLTTTDWATPTDDASGDNAGGDTLPPDDTDHGPVVTSGDGPPIVVDPAKKSPKVDPVDQTFGSNGHGDRAADDGAGDDNSGDNGGIDPPPTDDGAGDDNSGDNGGIDPPPPTDGSGDDDSSGADVPTVGQVLTPGSGFAGPTPTPAPIGSGPGSDAQAIARWDVVPFQTFTGGFSIGVVAFHINGIDRVEFSVDGGPWASVYDMTLNPRTHVWEYSVTLDAARFEDGPVEVRAIAYPTAGAPRVLQGAVNQNENSRISAGEESVFLYANAGGTLSTMTVHVAAGGDDSASGAADKPVATLTEALNRINQAGPDIGHVLIEQAGTYGVVSAKTWPIPKGVKTWITIEPAAELSAESVIVRMPSRGLMRPKVDRLHWKRLTFDWATILEYYPEPTHVIWWDQMIFTDSNGRDYPYNGTNQRYQVRGDNSGGYATDVTVRDSFHGVPSMSLVRGAHVSRIAGDCFYGSSMVLHSEVEDFDGNINPWHSDVFQFPATVKWENQIYFDIVVSAHGTVQPIFFGWTGDTTFKDFAFVNVAVRVDGDSVAQTQLGSRTDHLLFWQYSQIGRDFTFRDDRTFVAPTYQNFVPTNVSFINAVISKLNRGKFGWPGVPEGVAMQSVHLIDPGYVSATDGKGMTFGPVRLDFDAPTGSAGLSHARYSGPASGKLVNSGAPIPGGAPWLRDTTGGAPDRGASPE